MNQKLFPNPCEYVKESCRKVMAKAEHVTLNKEKITEFVQQLLQNEKLLAFPCWGESHFPPETESFELFLRYVFTIDTLNYCFWPNPPFEYFNLAKNLYNTLKNNKPFFDIEHLTKITSQELKDAVFKCDFCLIEERARMVREVFTVISLEHNGSVIEFVKKAKKSASQLVKLIIDSFPCFRDTAIYKGEQVFLYKRAQILVSDLHLAYRDLFKAQGKNDENELINFGDSVSELTMFADYRVPQILREIKILHYNEELAKKIDNKEEISHGSCFEVELRAATIIAVEDIKAELAMKNKKVLSLEIDTYLWEEGEKIKEKIQPPHHTLSIFY